MGCTQRQWAGETVPGYGRNGAAVACVNAAFVGRVQAGPSSSASESATRTERSLRTYWLAAYGTGPPCGAVPGCFTARLDHPLFPFTPGWCSVCFAFDSEGTRMAADLVGLVPEVPLFAEVRVVRPMSP